MDNKITIFLSHSHKDTEKVRKIRDLFEILNCEPLIFFLKCLEDSNTELEEFIKEEIEARNIFVYCKSKNSESSIWVQKEIQYIKSFDVKRFFEIDIENSFEEDIIRIMNQIISILKYNRIFISCSYQDIRISDVLRKHLIDLNYNVFDFDRFENNYSLDKIIDKSVEKTMDNGIFICIISENFIKSKYCNYELEAAKNYIKKNNRGIILPIVLINPKSLDNYLGLGNIKKIYLSYDPNKEELNNMTLILNEIIKEKYNNDIRI